METELIDIRGERSLFSTGLLTNEVDMIWSPSLSDDDDPAPVPRNRLAGYFAVQGEPLEQAPRFNWPSDPRYVEIPTRDASPFEVLDLFGDHPDRATLTLLLRSLCLDATSEIALKVFRRILYLQKAVLDEGQEVSKKSLAGFLEFLRRIPEPSYPIITVAHDEFIQAEWRPDNGMRLEFVFLPSGNIRHLIVRPDWQSSTGRSYDSGVSSLDKLIDKLKKLDYIHRLTA